MKKHAYLIMAHGHYPILLRLLSLLDDERNDIFLHIDKKAKDVPFEKIRGQVTAGRLFFTKRTSVYWGGSSQVDCELLLLKACLRQGEDYAYVHLLSGVDLPIKTQDEIHAFFGENDGKQFLQVGSAEKHLQRLSRYRFLQNTPFPILRERVNRFAGRITTALHLPVDRLRRYPGLKIVKTANWFSLTGPCAAAVYAERRWIRRLTRFTVCADEMFLGTVIAASPYWAEVYNPAFSWDGHMRFIDRIRNEGPSPHTFTMQDKEALDESDMLFARKFDETKDDEIIEYLYRKLKK